MNITKEKLEDLAQSILDIVDDHCNLDGVDDWNELLLIVKETINHSLDLEVDLPDTLDGEEE